MKPVAGVPVNVKMGRFVRTSWNAANMAKLFLSFLKFKHLNWHKKVTM